MIMQFFQKMGVEGVLEWEDLFNRVTDAGIIGHGEQFIKMFAARVAMVCFSSVFS